MTATDPLRAAIAEQARLRRQMQHEVRNSLQIIASMLALAVRDADTPAVHQLHLVMQAQIQTLGLVQHWLHREDAGSSIDLPGLVGQLADALEGRLVSADHGVVRISRRIGSARLPAEQAVPLGFLITELALLASRCSPPGPLSIGVELAVPGGLAMAAAGFQGGDPLAMPGSTVPIIRAMVAQLAGGLVHDGDTGVIRVTLEGPAASK